MGEEVLALGEEVRCGKQGRREWLDEKVDKAFQREKVFRARLTVMDKEMSGAERDKVKASGGFWYR